MEDVTGNFKSIVEVHKFIERLDVYRLSSLLYMIL
mgnify:CR=1 FL=1